MRSKPIEDEATVKAMLARVPPSWTLAHRSTDGGMFKRGNVQVIVSIAVESDGRAWLHVSACGRRSQNDYHLLGWEDLKRVKNDFIGPECWAYQVFPPRSEWVNINAYVLHMFALLDGSPALPDFTGKTEYGRTI